MIIVNTTEVIRQYKCCLDQYIVDNDDMCFAEPAIEMYVSLKIGPV